MFRKAHYNDGEIKTLMVPKVDKLSPSEVRLRPTFCGLCGSDIHYYNNKNIKKCPGHEISAFVEEIGINVTSVNPGDRVIVEPLLGCGSCQYCKRGEKNGCNNRKVIGVTLDGGFSDELIVPHDLLFKVPDTVDGKTAALTEPLAVAVHAFRCIGTIDKDTNILILGAGTIGLTCLSVASYFGLKSISITGKYPFQLELANKIANETGVKLTTYNTNFDGLTVSPDVVIETVGGTNSVLDDAIKHVKTLGKIITLGVFTPGRGKIDPTDIILKSLTIVGSNCYDRVSSPCDFEVALQILQKHGEFLKNCLITHTFNLDNIGEAYVAATNKSNTGALKVMIHINK